MARPAGFPQRSGSGRCGWCWSTRTSTSPVGGDRVDRREDRLLAETLRHWVRQAERDTGRRPGLTTDERQRLKQLERENLELRRANEILRQGVGVFRAGGARPPSEVMVAFIDAHRDDVRGRADLRGPADRPVGVLRAQGADAAIPSASRREPGGTRGWCEHIARVWREHREVYGVRKVWKQLAARGRGRGPLHGGAADAAPRAGRGGAGPGVPADDHPGHRGRAAAGSGHAPVHGDAAESAVGRGPDLRRDLARGSCTWRS